jgi:ribosomal protein S18 acetylase RimI-like enzyme
MGGLSNSDLVCRPVQRGEIEPALRLILATSCGLAADAQVLDFLSFCVERKIDTNAIWIAVHQGRLVWSMLPVASPGKTMLIFTPPVLFEQTPGSAIQRLGDDVCEHYAQRGVQLAQMLVDPGDRPVIEAYRHGGFHELAELVYLQKLTRARKLSPPILPNEFEMKAYGPDTHSHFADVIQRSYEQSLDCPALNGLREMDDVIAGHQATGEFDPNLWWVLYQQQRPLAVLMLSRIPQTTTVELVYLGLAPEARGRGVGDLLMQQALAVASGDGRESISLAVDSRNQPALRLYYRHGMRRIGSRVALLRDLQRGVQGSGFEVPEKAAAGLPSLNPEP